MRARLALMCVPLAAVLAGVGGCTSGAGSSGAADTATGGTTAPTAGGTPPPSGKATKPGPTKAPTPPPTEKAKPSVAVSTAPPVSLGSTATINGQVLVTVGRPRTVTVAARGPGEIAGPALSVPVSVTNSSSSPFPLGGLVVNLTYGTEAEPASPTNADPAKPLQGRLAAGSKATGTYVFLVPRGASRVRVEVVSDVSAKIVTFAG